MHLRFTFLIVLLIYSVSESALSNASETPEGQVKGAEEQLAQDLPRLLLFPSIKVGYSDTTLVIPACGRER